MTGTADGEGHMWKLVALSAALLVTETGLRNIQRTLSASARAPAICTVPDDSVRVGRLDRDQRLKTETPTPNMCLPEDGKVGRAIEHGPVNPLWRKPSHE